MPPLATLDLVGLDIHKAIIESLHNNTNDEMHDLFALPDYINTMIEKRLLGNKTKAGFYKKLEGEEHYFLTRPRATIYRLFSRISVLSNTQNSSFTSECTGRPSILLKMHSGKEADIVMDILCTYISYAYSRIGEITDAEYGINGIDKVMSDRLPLGIAESNFEFTWRQKRGFKNVNSKRFECAFISLRIPMTRNCRFSRAENFS